MVSYVITGASRGIGFGFLRELSADASNVVIGLVRDKVTTENKIAAEIGKRQNIYILQADITDSASLKESNWNHTILDILIANAAFMSPWSAWTTVDIGAEEPERFDQDFLDAYKANVLGNLHLFTLFLPLILKGKVKKVIAISSGMADDDLTRTYDLDLNAPYAVTKSALNTVVAKFSARYRQDGVLFMSICPGSVDTGYKDKVPEDKGEKLQEMLVKFKTYAPHFTGMATVEAAVKDTLSVIDKASVANGSAGAFVSHLGNRQWL
ncbi:NAD(P)-binding protein [Thozetella sp. PMI_491]|nr:NAD(P)-binding protein [Thozetella sp. PMI_491]